MGFHHIDFLKPAITNFAIQFYAVVHLKIWWRVSITYISVGTI